MDLREVATGIPLHSCCSEPLWERGPSDLSESFYYVFSWSRALGDRRRVSRGGTELGPWELTIKLGSYICITNEKPQFYIG